MSKYNKIMDKIRITPEMHERIMSNINETDFEIQKPKEIFLKKYRRYISIAACFMIFIASIMYIQNIVNMEKNQMQVVPDIVEYSSKSDLSSSVGFEVKDIKNIPFDVEEIQYISYWKDLAQIIYVGKDNSITFRMSKGNEEVSGDYNEYEETKTYTLDSNSITLKGSKGLYNLAIWKDDNFSYSLQLDVAMSEEDLSYIIESIE